MTIYPIINLKGVTLLYLDIIEKNLGEYMKAIILAGGLGTRLGLKDMPKTMCTIADKPVLEWNILLLKNHNIKDICIALHHMPEVIKDYFGDGSKWGVNIQYSYEESPLGTSGGVKNAEWFINNEIFFVVYGDNYTNINLSQMLQNYTSEKPTVQVCVFDPNVNVNCGIAGGYVSVGNDNNILSFVEGKQNGNKEGYKKFVNAGVYILKPEILNIIPKDKPSDFGKDIFPKLLKDGYSLKAYLTNSFVIALDTKETLNIANRLIKSGTVK